MRNNPCQFFIASPQAFDTQDENGSPLLCSAESQKVWDSGKRLFHSRIELNFERGVGLTDDANQGHEPKVRLMYSDDDGNSWYDREWKTIGQKGEYKHRCWWAGLGSSYERIYKIEVSDPVEWIMTGAELSVS